MNINPVSTGNAAPVNQAPALKKKSTKEAGKAGVKDSFAHAAKAEETHEMPKSVEEITVRVLKTKGLQKSKYSFRVQSQAKGNDGNLYVAYSDSQKDDGNYIAALNPDGSVKWETDSGGKGLESIKTGPDGTIFARTKDTLMGYHPDGKIKFRHTFAEEVKDHYVDKDGNNYFRKAKGNALVMVDAEGNLKKTPLVIRDKGLQDIKVEKDGTIWARDGRKILNFDPVKGKTKSSFSFEEELKDTNTFIEEFSPTADNGILAMARNVRSVNSHAFAADLHMGLGFGRRFGGMPHLPPDYEMSYTTITTNTMIKQNAEGEIQWKTDVGSTIHNAYLNDGTMIYAGSDRNEDKKIIVRKLNEKGEKEDFAAVDGYVSSMEQREEDDHLFIKHGTQMSEYAPDGSLVRTSEMDGLKKDTSIFAFEDKGNILLTDSGKKNLYRWNPESDKIECLTNHENDFSYRTAVYKDPEEIPLAPAKKIEHKDEFVIIGGVKLPKNK